RERDDRVHRLTRPRPALVQSVEKEPEPPLGGRSSKALVRDVIPKVSELGDERGNQRLLGRYRDLQERQEDGKPRTTVSSGRTEHPAQQGRLAGASPARHEQVVPGFLQER